MLGTQGYLHGEPGQAFRKKTLFNWWVFRALHQTRWSMFLSYIVHIYRKPLDKNRKTNNIRVSNLYSFSGSMPPQGPLFELPKMIPQCIRFDSMHTLCLGVDLMVAGNVINSLLAYEFWGDGDDSQKLLTGWKRFKQWAKTNGWQPLD